MLLDSNNSMPLAAAHNSFITILSYEDCYDLHYYPEDFKCSFVLSNSESCGSRETFISYTPYIYCFGIISPGLQSIAVITFMILLLVALFLLIGLLAERFLFPVVNIVAHRMGLSESLAGTTLIAIGLGLPGIFTIFLIDFSHTVETLVEEVLGFTIFNVSVIPACIVILKPFRVVSRQYHRDTIFLIISVSLNAIFISDRKFSMMEGISLYAIYAIYLTVVIGDHFLQIHRAKKRELLRENIESTQEEEIAEEIMEIEAECVVRQHKRNHFGWKMKTNKRLFQNFLDNVTPLEEEILTPSTYCYERFVEVLQAPLYLALLLTIPNIDYTVTSKKWCKLLNVAHCITCPQLIAFLFQVSNEEFIGVPLWLILLVIGLIGSVIVFMTSAVETEPRYHIIFIIMSLMGTIVAMYFISEEIDSILFTLGVASKISTATLKLTILAWGGSASELVSSLALTKQGYHRTGFAMVYGVPMFYLGVFIPTCFIYEMIKSGEESIPCKFGNMGVTVTIFLAMIVFMQMIAITLAGNCARRSVGVYTLIIYGIFLLYCILAEVEIIHDYGTNHEDLKTFYFQKKVGE